MPKPGPKEEETPKWKFAVIVWLAIFPAVCLVNYLLEPVTEGWPLWSKILLISLIEVPYAVYLGIPFLQKVFRGWLKGGDWSQGISSS